MYSTFKRIGRYLLIAAGLIVFFAIGYALSGPVFQHGIGMHTHASHTGDNVTVYTDVGDSRVDIALKLTPQKLQDPVEKEYWNVTGNISTVFFVGRFGGGLAINAVNKRGDRYAVATTYPEATEGPSIGIARSF